MEQQKTERAAILTTLMALLERIDYYQWEGGPYDEWEEDDACSIVSEAASHTLGPLFVEWQDGLDQLAALEPAVAGELRPETLGPPIREVWQGADQRAYVRYYYSGEHLRGLAREVRKAIGWLSGQG